MKRFIFFAGCDCYPEGGWNDFLGSSDSIEEALERIANAACDWWQIVDTYDGQIAKKGSR